MSTSRNRYFSIEWYKNGTPFNKYQNLVTLKKNDEL